MLYISYICVYAYVIESQTVIANKGLLIYINSQLPLPLNKNSERFISKFHSYLRQEPKVCPDF